MKKEIYILVGPAGIGKTTYINSIGFPQDRLAIISRDDVVRDVSAKYGLSFDDLYHFPPHDSKSGDFIPGFEHCGMVIESPSVVVHLHPFSYEYLDSINAEINFTYYNQFQHAIRNPDIDFIVVDKVHLRKKEREEYLRYLLPNRQAFYVTAVQFNCEDPDTLNIIAKTSEIRTKRMKASGGRYRTVERKVQENMLKFAEPLTDADGFDSIQKVDTLPMLRSTIMQEYFNNGFDESGTCPHCGFSMISLNSLCTDSTDKYRAHDYDTDICVSCKEEFIVHQITDDIFNPGEPFTRYETSK